MAMIQSVHQPAANVALTLYNGAAQAAALDVTVTQRGSRLARARLALAAAAAPAAGEWIEYEALLRPGVPLMNAGIVVPLGRRLVLLVDGADCMAELHGEEIAGETSFAAVASLAANTDTVLLTMPADDAPRACHVNLCNRAVGAVLGRIAVAAADVPQPHEWLEFDGPLRPGTPLRRWPLILKPTQRLVVRASGASVSATAWGRTYGAPIA